MSIKSRKYKIIERVMQLNEQELKQVEKFLSNNLRLDSELNKAAEDVTAGRTHPHEDVRKKYEKWL